VIVSGDRAGFSYLPGKEVTNNRGKRAPSTGYRLTALAEEGRAIKIVNQDAPWSHPHTGRRHDGGTVRDSSTDNKAASPDNIRREKMKKKLVALFAAALMTISFAGTAMAAFSANTADGNLLRVVYDTKGTKEYATDLGSWNSLTGATNGTVVGGGVDAITLATFGGTTTLADLYVGYYLVTNATPNHVAIAGDANGLTSGSRVFNGISNGIGGTTVYTTYANNLIAGTNSAVVADKTAGFTFYAKSGPLTPVAGNGSYGGWVTASSNPGGVLNLAALTTTGYVDQTIYSWSATNLQNPGTPTAGTAAFTVRTMADGTTVLGNGNIAAAPVPVPPAFFLMGSGLLGIFGVRRKMNA
jgi:hypothetical protein